MKLTYDDRQHGYWLDGKRCKSISAVAKIPDDTFSLDQWRKRQLLIGVALLPQLAERAAAHFDDRDQLERIAEEAMSAAKSHEAAARGTAAHRITERIDLQEGIIDTPQARAVRAAWTKALDIAGLEIVPELVERIVVYPERRIAGRFDRIMRRRADGRHVVVDLKTGTSAVKYPHSIAVQLALYANAPLMAGPIPREGGKTETFEELPELDRSVGYVIHMPNDDEVDVVGIDLEQGQQGAAVCFDVLGWRGAKELVIPVTEIPVNPQPDVEVETDRSGWIAGRLATVAAIGPEAKQYVADRWPEGVPTRPPWTAAHIDLLDTVLGAAEVQFEAPFPARDPATPSEVAEPVGREAPPALPEPPADGPSINPEDIDTIRRQVAALPEPARNRMRLWASQGRNNDRPWAGGDGAMPRRHEHISRAALAVARLGEDGARAAIGEALGSELQPTWPTGAALGCLSAEQADHLLDLATNSTPATRAG